MDDCTVSIQMQIIFENHSATRAVAQATAQGFQLHEPKLWAFLSLDDGPTRPGFGMAGPGWLTALGRAWHITNYGLIPVESSGIWWNLVESTGFWSHSSGFHQNDQSPTGIGGAQ